MIKIIIVLILLYLYYSLNRTDGFTLLEESSFIKIDNDILDGFYSRIYDDLYDTIPIHTKECECIAPYLNANSDVLCVDSRTGHMVQLLSGTSRIIGLESSTYFVDRSKQKYPDLSFQYSKYNPFSFKTKTHIICPMFSIHTKNDIGGFLNVCSNWLMHNGYLFISYMDNIDNITDIINNNPCNKFKYNYKFSLEIEKKPGHSILSENIYNKDDTMKRKNIWNLNNIQLDNLIHEAGIRGFKFLKECRNKPFNMAIFIKNT